MPETLDSTLIGAALAALVAVVGLACLLAKLVALLVKRRNGERRHVGENETLAFREELREYVRRDDAAHESSAGNLADLRRECASTRSEVQQIRADVQRMLVKIEGIATDVEWLKSSR